MPFCLPCTPVSSEAVRVGLLVQVRALLVMSVAGQAWYPESVLCRFLDRCLSFLPPDEYSALLSAPRSGDRLAEAGVGPWEEIRGYMRWKSKSSYRTDRDFTDTASAAL